MPFLVRIRQMLQHLRHARRHTPHPDVVEHGRPVVRHRAGQGAAIVLAVRLRKQMLEAL